MNRIFLVGCSRSGTSVIQKELVTKLNLWSLPETSFLIYPHKTLDNKIKNIQRLIGNCGIATKALSKFEIWSHSVKVVGDELTFKYLTEELSPLDYLTAFLDRVSGSFGYKNWIEKSPTHYQSTQEILEQSEKNWVIFVARNGLDVVGSIRDRAIKNPEHFSNQYRLDYGVGLWNDSIKVAKKNMLNERFLVVSYGAFCESPDKVVNNIKNKIGLDLKINNDDKIETIGKGENWKDSVNSRITKSEAKKHLFSNEELNTLESTLNIDDFINLTKSGSTL